MTDAIDNLQDLSIEHARQLQQHGLYAQAEATCQQLIEASTEPRQQLAARILKALVLMQTDHPEQAGQLVEDLPELDDALTMSDLGLVYVLRGDLQQARTLLETATHAPDTDYAAYARLGSVKILMNDLAEGEADIREALSRSPEHPLLLSNLGGVLMRQDKVIQALEAYEGALRLKPDLQVAEKGRIAAFMMLDRTDELLDEVDTQLDEAPGDEALLYKKANILVTVERFDEARDIFREMIERYPDSLEYRLLLASLHMREEQHRLAHKVLEAADTRFPDEIQVLNMLARTENSMKRHDEAMAIVERILEMVPDLPMALVTRAHIHSDKENYAEAETDLRKALETHPGMPDAWSLLGHNLLWLGRLDEAVACMEKAAMINPGALSSLVEARAIPEDPAVLELMARFASHRLIPSEARSSMNFALIKVCEKQENYDAAFKHAEVANQLQRQMIKHDEQKSHKMVDALKNIFVPELFERLEGMGNYSERPVFVVGMPRSGTTLTEQMLCSHSAVYGAGELGYIPSITRLMPRVLKIKKRYPQCMNQVKQRTIDHAAIYYLQKLDKYDATSKRVVDKLPHNFLHLGLIAILFPYAKIIHVRREPRDIAISNFFTNFKMKRGGMSYAFDLAEIGHMINDYRRIMDYWHKVLPIDIFDFDYETLVTDPEKTARDIISFVGLPWEPGVMDFYKQDRAVRTASVWQVRQPIYVSSKARWLHYKDHLVPLETVLAQYDEVPQYEEQYAW